jgi:hypothetical protein
MVVSPLTGLAHDDRYDEPAESRTEDRLSAREQQKFDAFLDAHEETATELERDPTLINNERCLRRQTELRNWLEENPRIAETLQADPQAALGRGRATTRREPEERRSAAARMDERDLQSFETYLETHDETARQLYQNPALVNDRQFVRDHDALNDWLRGYH